MKQKKGKKNIPFEDIKNEVNSMLDNNNLTQEEKKAISMLFERLSMKSDNYKGFNYIKWVKEQGSKQWLDLVDSGKIDKWDYAKKAEFMGPEYNRFYY
jgi:hypothetical protein